MADTTPGKTFEQSLGWLYDQITGDEDARVCKDIPDEACTDQPRNFFAYLFANLTNKIADELASARLTLPWLFSALGVPAAFTGFLVPIREAGVLIPQLFVAAYVRALPRRNIVWFVGAFLSGVTLALMAAGSAAFSGVMAGWLIISLLIVHSLARGLCSVSAKDVLGKTVSKTRRGALMGYSAGIAGVFTLVIGLYVKFEAATFQTQGLLVAFLAIAAALWAVAIVSFMQINEPAGSTEGGGNAFIEALKSLSLLKDDPPFRQFVMCRALMLSIALVPPFYVILAQENIEHGVAGFGLLFIANGIAGSLSAPVWGKLSDRSSRLVMASAAALSALIGIATWYMSNAGTQALISSPWYYMALFFLVSMAHGGVRLGRKVYLVDMATQETRAQYVAISNTIIGIAMLFGGAIGILGDIFDAATVILVLSVIALIGTVYTLRMEEVSG